MGTRRTEGATDELTERIRPQRGRSGPGSPGCWTTPRSAPRAGRAPGARRRRPRPRRDPRVAPRRGRHDHSRRGAADPDALRAPGRGVRRAAPRGGGHPGLSAGSHLSRWHGGHRRRPLPFLAHPRAPRPAPAGRGPARGTVAPPRRPGARAPGHGGHIVRGVGTRRPGGPGGGRLQRLGRPPEPDAVPGQLRRLGDLPARDRSRRSLQVRGGQPAGAAQPAGGPVRLRHRGSAGHGQRGHPERVRVAGRGLVRRTGGHRPAARAGIDLRMPSGLVAADPGRRRMAPADLPRDG